MNYFNSLWDLNTLYVKVKPHDFDKTMCVLLFKYIICKS